VSRHASRSPLILQRRRGLFATQPQPLATSLPSYLTTFNLDGVSSHTSLDPHVALQADETPSKLQRVSGTTLTQLQPLSIFFFHKV